MQRSRLAGSVLASVAVSLGFAIGVVEAAPAALSREGKALLRIRVATDASEEVRRSAADLARLLGRMGGAEFAVTAEAAADGREIVLGRAAAFPDLAREVAWDAKDIAGREQYLLRADAAGVRLLGATDTAVDEAMWDFLYRLGYRRYFPGANWEIVPPARDLSVELNVVTRPDYFTRVIWFGYGAWDYNAAPYREWQRANRMPGRFRLSSGHAYDNILRRNAALFKAHPEYLGLWKGERTSSKFCVSNPDLRKAVAVWAVNEFRSNPDLDSISMEPSDGGEWCQCPECAAIGSVSDRAITLANEVARAVRAEAGEKYIGLYAYNEHSPPPQRVRVEPNVVVSAATGFIRGGYTYEQLLEGWGQAGGKYLGVREYYTLGGRDLPGRERASRLTYLCDTIPRFHSKGARFLSAESADNWGPCGLGYYIASRLMWDVKEAGRVDAHVEEFVTNCFGAAAGPMRAFYTLINVGPSPLTSDDLVGRMYRLLAEAREKSGDAAVRARLTDLVLYTRYVEAFRDYSNAPAKSRQEAFEFLIRHAYRMRKTMMVHVKGLYRDLPNRDRSVKVPADCAWNVPAPKNPWKSDEPFSDAEIEAFLKQGTAKHALLDFKPVSFSEELVPPAGLTLGPGPSAQPDGLPMRGRRTFYLWVAKAPGEVRLTVTAGLIAHYRDRGAAKLTLYPVNDELGRVASEAAVPPDGQPREVLLATQFDGLHRLEVTDGNDMTQVNWPAGFPMVLEASLESRPSLSRRWTLYFYVPAGTREVGGYANADGVMETPDGKKVFTFPTAEGFFRVPVPPGQDGRLWRLRQVGGGVYLMTVPPFLARSAEEMIVPKEILAKP
jgi:hypothetical protein